MSHHKYKRSSSELASHQSSSSIEKLDGNFCGAFQEHYEYLMDEGLIETCQVSREFISFHFHFEFNQSISLVINVWHLIIVIILKRKLKIKYSKKSDLLQYFNAQT